MCSLEINLLRNLSRKCACGEGGGVKSKKQTKCSERRVEKKKATIWFKSTTELVRQMETLKTARNEAHIFRDYIYHRSNQEQKG